MQEIVLLEKKLTTEEVLEVVEDFQKTVMAFPVAKDNSICIIKTLIALRNTKKKKIFKGIKTKTKTIKLLKNQKYKFLKKLQMRY